MSKRTSIRITDRDKAEIRKLNQSVNSKKRRFQGKGMEVVDMETKGITSFSTRKELNEYKEKMRNFTNRYATQFKVKNENDVEATYLDIVRTERKIRERNKEREKEWKRIKDKPKLDVSGKETGLTIGEYKDQLARGKIRQMGSSNYDTYDPEHFNFGDWGTKEALDKYLKKKKNALSIKEAQQQWKTNYISALHKVFGDTELDYSKVLEAVSKMSVKQFTDQFITQGASTITYIYSFREQLKKLKQLEEEWA